MREIAKRLMEGLKEKIPDQQERINHIFTHQLYGIAITELTGLLARRSVYCSKKANSPYSICETFTTEQGNIRFNRIEHTWQRGKCIYCGASQEVYDRADILETHAYEFIHKENPEEIFDMRFDVIVGNPPYQLNVGVQSKSFSIAIYDKFVEQAKKLNPRYLVMIIPSRWFSGGRGLDKFRNNMLNDKKIKNLVDFTDSSICFPGVEIKGGVCYFLWDREYYGDCEIISYRKDKKYPMVKRPLLEKNLDTFIRYNEAISIFKKVQKYNVENFSILVSVQTPFGFISSFKDFKLQEFPNSIKLYLQSGIGYVKKSQITKNIHLVDKYKIYISKSYNAGENFPHQIINKPFLGDKNTCCTQTYLVIAPFDSKEEANNAISYMKTKFFRFMVMLKKISQDAMRNVYSLVPLQDFTQEWTDEKLYAKYGLDEDEIAFIESMIRPMEL